MTKNELRNAVRNISTNLMVRECDGEIRVSILVTHIMEATGRNYASAQNVAGNGAYYTDDREDALGTARLMWVEFNRKCGR